MKNLSEEKREKITSALKERYKMMKKMRPDSADAKLSEREFVEKYFVTFAAGQKIFGYVLLGLVAVGLAIAVISNL